MQQQQQNKNIQKYTHNIYENMLNEKKSSINRIVFLFELFIFQFNFTYFSYLVIEIGKKGSESIN